MTDLIEENDKILTQKKSKTDESIVEMLIRDAKATNSKDIEYIRNACLELGFCI